MKDLVGRKVGKLTVVKNLGLMSGARNGKPRIHWLCRCDCGAEVAVCSSNLNLAKTTQSCGCGRKATNHSSWKGFGELSGVRWKTILRNAKERKIDVSITIEDAWNQWLSQNGRCALTGWELIIYSSYSSSVEVTASLDRIDNTKGYCLGNIQWVHKWVNQAKSDLQQKDFIEMCRAIANRGTDDE